MSDSRGEQRTLLNLAARRVNAGVRAILDAIPAVLGEDKPKAMQRLSEASIAVQEGYLSLLRAGADKPEGGTQPKEIPLHTLDTDDTRRLLSLLEQAQEVAERIDAARGRALSESVSSQPGESRGLDLAESLSYLTLRVRTEVYGPKGLE